MPNTEWTDDDAKAFEALAAKKAAAEKAALAPALAALGSAEDVRARIAALEAVRPSVGVENQTRIDRILINLRVEVLGLIAAAQ